MDGTVLMGYPKKREKKRKRIAIFGSGLTSRYKRSYCRAYSTAAEKLDIDLVIFNTYGQIGRGNALNDDFESEILNYIDLDQFDGIVYDSEGYNVDGMSDKVERKLRSAKCAVVSISSKVEGFYSIDFDDAGGLRKMVEHFFNCHHFTKIGFMSGNLDHPDAQIRLNEFRSIMRDYGLPEDGVGMFEGDFWFNKGTEAAQYFLSLPDRPEAIVCANDYMAIALINALRKRGINVPEDIAVSGYDGSIEGQELLPHISSVTRERSEIAYKALALLVDIAENGKSENPDIRVTPKHIYTQSCGCEPLDYQHVLETVARLHDEKRFMSFAVFDSESAMLQLNRVKSVAGMEAVFEKNSINFGKYLSFFLMVHVDSKGAPAYSSDFTMPSGNFTPAIWIDKNDEYSNSPRCADTSNLIPDSSSDRSHVYYVMTVHSAGKMYGYSAIEMTGKDIFDEFYNVWMLNLGMTLNALQMNDRVNKLIGKLEGLSITDGLTGMLNRRGFDNKSREAIAEFHEKITVCTMVLDMDGLKRINDEFGHSEGDRAIKALADMIVKCCDSGEIAGRVGGDEFYIFAPDYSEIRLNRFVERIRNCVDDYNKANPKRYKFDFSYGTYLTETDSFGSIEEFLKISDTRMYQQKMTKPGRRK